MGENKANLMEKMNWGFMFRPTTRLTALISGLVLFSVVLMGFRHPYHVSVTTIIPNKLAKTMHVEVKVFYHDLESAVNTFAGTEIDIKNHEEKQLRDSLLYGYLKQHFKIQLDGTTATWTDNKLYFIDEYALVQLSYTNVAGKNISIINTICFETEPTQTNLFHFHSDGKKRTKKTVNPDAEVSFSL